MPRLSSPFRELGPIGRRSMQPSRSVGRRYGTGAQIDVVVEYPGVNGHPARVRS